VHRSTRGWSYGASVVDPRTGEIIKGNVLLGSLRIRQDVMIARGLSAEFDDMDPSTSPAQMALARIRQLSAHETGHTLGLDHNFAASTYGRASVMDYPAPYIKITNGKLDLSEAYAKGVAAYDVAAIKYAYTQFAPGANEDEELTKLARATPLFVSDAHSRPVSSAHPLGAVWDNGADPIAMLRHEIEVRRIALDQFGIRNINNGEPLSALEEKLVPLYLHHRYQLEAAAKSIGGIYYTYAVKDAAGVWPDVVRKVVPPEQQRDALRAILTTLDPAFLTIPQRILDLIPPPAYGHGDANTELFPRHTDPAFDPISAAMTSADVTISALLDPARCARVAQQSGNVTLREITNALIDSAAKSGPIARATRTVLMVRLAGLAASPDNDAEVRAEATDALRRLADRLAATTSDPAEAAHRRLTREDIARFLARPAEAWKPSSLPAVPPGPPI
jgi:hypothetical protein